MAIDSLSDKPETWKRRSTDGMQTGGPHAPNYLGNIDILLYKINITSDNQHKAFYTFQIHKNCTHCWSNEFCSLIFKQYILYRSVVYCQKTLPRECVPYSSTTIKTQLYGFLKQMNHIDHDMKLAQDVPLLLLRRRWPKYLNFASINMKPRPSDYQ